jgi:hypothetical protein
MEEILWVFISPQIPVFFLWSNQTVIPIFFLCFVILCFTLIFLSESYFFLFLYFFIPVIQRGPRIIPIIIAKIVETINKLDVCTADAWNMGKEVLCEADTRLLCTATFIATFHSSLTTNKITSPRWPHMHIRMRSIFRACSLWC